MGTHLCPLPAGEHCPRGLVCLGCSSAQPKKSAVPLFQRMLSSHQAALERARGAREPAGQLGARELEVQRISSALRGALSGSLTTGVPETSLKKSERRCRIGAVLFVAGVRPPTWGGAKAKEPRT
jgi:hypothetical protein